LKQKMPALEALQGMETAVAATVTSSGKSRQREAGPSRGVSARAKHPSAKKTPVARKRG
jgi:hypothetical protein